MQTADNTITAELYYLCLIYSKGQVLPVYLPDSAFVEEGDVVSYESEGKKEQGIVRFVKLCNPGCDVWRAVTVATQTSPIKGITPPYPMGKISMEVIISTVAEHFHITEQDIRGSEADPDIKLPREIAMYLCRNMTSHTLGKIGEALGKNDTTTVMRGIQKVDDDIGNDKDIRGIIEELKKRIRQRV